MLKSNHNASESSLGYLYQNYMALCLLLEEDNDDCRVTIEHFEDVSLHFEEGREHLVQMKSHKDIKKNKLTSTSPDLWKTLLIWIKYIKENPNSDTNYILMTTSQVAKDTAPFFLMSKNRNIKKACNLLLEVSNNATNKKLVESYKLFQEIDVELRNKLLQKITILGENDNLDEVLKKIKKYLKYSCYPKFIDDVHNQLLGWWDNKVIEILKSKHPIFVTKLETINKIRTIADQYRDDNLPDFNNIVTNENIKEIKSTAMNQLKFLEYDEKQISNKLINFYRASAYRNNILNYQIIFIDELDKYDNKLENEWNRLYYIMKDDLNELDEEITEKIKIRKGKDLLNQLEGQEILIRQLFNDPFFMRGSFHILADDKKIGWHIDYKEKLKELSGNSCENGKKDQER